MQTESDREGQEAAGLGSWDCVWTKSTAKKWWVGRSWGVGMGRGGKKGVVHGGCGSLFSWGGIEAGRLVFIKEDAKETRKEGAELGLHVLGLLGLRAQKLIPI